MVFITESDIIGDGKLMHDFFCTDPDEMHYGALAERARYYKYDEEGVTKVGRFAEEIEKDTTIRIAKNLLSSGKLTEKEISVYTDLPEEEVRKLAQENIGK